MNRIIVVLVLLPGLAAAQSATKVSTARPDGEATAAQSQIPVRTLDFKPIEPNPGLSISPVTEAPTQCSADGFLFLDILDIKDLQKHTVVAIRGTQSQTYSPASIPDLHDITVYSFFPSDSIVGFLVHGSTTMPGARGAGKSPAGIPWTEYHNYIAEFNRDGQYLKSIELPFNYMLSHFAILPTGEFVVSGYDKLNSTPRLMFLDSSGKIIRPLDWAPYRKPVGGDYGSEEAAKAARELIGHVLLTPYKQDILVWHLGSNDPILDVGPGASVREVPLQPPPGYIFDGMIPSNDRWVAHFRSKDTAPESPLNQTNYAYFDLRPEDASISAKLMQTGYVPLSIACESDGAYIAFKRDNNNKLIVVKAE